MKILTDFSVEVLILKELRDLLKYSPNIDQTS